MKDKMIFVIYIASITLIVWGLYDVFTEVQNYNDGQGYWMVGIGVFMGIVATIFKAVDKPGR